MGSLQNLQRPRGLMDKASDFGSEDCEFESRRGRKFQFESHSQNHKLVLMQITQVSSRVGRWIQEQPRQQIHGLLGFVSGRENGHNLFMENKLKRPANRNRTGDLRISINCTTTVLRSTN